MLARRAEQAQAELKAAIEANPNLAQAHMMLGLSYGYAGIADDGIRHLTLAMRLSPRDPLQAANLSSMGTCHFVAGRVADGARIPATGGRAKTGVRDGMAQPRRDGRARRRP